MLAVSGMINREDVMQNFDVPHLLQTSGTIKSAAGAVKVLQCKPRAISQLVIPFPRSPGISGLLLKAYFRNFNLVLMNRNRLLRPNSSTGKCQ